MMINSTILAAVPHALQAEFQTGQVYRIGVLLFRQGQSGILGHLIEGGGLQIASKAVIAANPVGQGLLAIGQVANLVQNEQIKAGIATLKSLQLENMMLSGIGIGVSVLSHALMAQRLGRIERQTEAINDKLDRIERLVVDMRDEVIKRDFIELSAFCEQADEAWLATNPEREWLTAADGLQSLQHRFGERVKQLLQSGAPLLIEPFVEAFTLAATNRISCRLAAGDTKVAIKAAQDLGQQLTALLAPVGVRSLVEAEMEADKVLIGSKTYMHSMDRHLPGAQQQAALYRDREEIALSLPHTLLQLESLGLNGRDWLEAARSMSDDPVLLMAGNSKSL